MLTGEFLIWVIVFYNNTYNLKLYDYDEAITIMHSLVSTKEQLNIMEAYNIHFPNTNEQKEACKQLFIRTIVIFI